MRRLPWFLVALAAWLASAPGGNAAAPSRIWSAEGTPEEVFGLTKVWPMHLTVQPADWEKMAPTRSVFGKGKQADPTKPNERKPRGGFGYDFEYVRADLDLDGVRLRDVGLRFKGNSSYATTSRVLKRPFKVDLDRFVAGQAFKGVRKFVLNNGVMDPSACREALAFAVYRAAGVPAPRTAFVELTLTVPGKFDREVAGLYVLIEAVDKTFLKDRFGSSKGLLLKPENVGPLDYLGEDWKPYEARYRPKTTATPRAQRRLIELTRLVQEADDVRFRAEIGKYLDTGRFLRYAAATVLLASMDSFVGLPHNYYLYLDPRTDRFVVLPWDLDHAFGALLMFGPATSLIDLSIRQPWLGRNPLVERLLGDEKTFAVYRGHLERLLKSGFTADGMKRDAAAIRAAVAPAKARERQGNAKRGDNVSLMLMGMLFKKPPEAEVFTARRIESVTAQLAGKSKGTVIRRPFAPAPGEHLVEHVVKQADRDGNGSLSPEEAREGAQTLFRACDGKNKGVLDQKGLESALVKLLPRSPGGLVAPPKPAAPLARALIGQGGKDGKIDEKSLAALVEKLFARADRDRNGQLNSREVGEALRILLPPAPFGRQAPPANPKKERKEGKS